MEFFGYLYLYLYKSSTHCILFSHPHLQRRDRSLAFYVPSHPVSCWTEVSTQLCLSSPRWCYFVHLNFGSFNNWCIKWAFDECRDNAVVSKTVIICSRIASPSDLDVIGTLTGLRDLTLSCDPWETGLAEALSVCLMPLFCTDCLWLFFPTDILTSVFSIKIFFFKHN